MQTPLETTIFCTLVSLLRSSVLVPLPELLQRTCADAPSNHDIRGQRKGRSISSCRDHEEQSGCANSQSGYPHLHLRDTHDPRRSVTLVMNPMKKG